MKKIFHFVFQIIFFVLLFKQAYTQDINEIRCAVSHCISCTNTEVLIGYLGIDNASPASNETLPGTLRIYRRTSSTPAGAWQLLRSYNPNSIERNTYYDFIDTNILDGSVSYDYKIDYDYTDTSGSHTLTSNIPSITPNAGTKNFSWPVKNGATPSYGILHNFHQIHYPFPYAGNTYYKFHNGIDINGELNIDSENVYAPISGIIRATNNLESGDIIMVVFYKGTKYDITLGHIDHPSVNICTYMPNNSLLGNITDETWQTQDNHLHWGIQRYDYLIPGAPPTLTIFNPYSFVKSFVETDGNLNTVDTGNQNVDPILTPPIVSTSNSNSHSIRFKQVPYSTTPPIESTENDYFAEGSMANEIREVYCAFDIIAEAFDYQSTHTSSSGVRHKNNPEIIGYYVQKRTGQNSWTNVVQTPTTPYILIDGRNHWFGVNHKAELPNHQDFVNTFIDSNMSLSATNAWDNNKWDHWFTFNVTNTNGLNGSKSNVDPLQCWVTNAPNSVPSENGFAPTNSTTDDPQNYQYAQHYNDLKFPDGEYRVCIHAADMIDDNDSQNNIEASCETVYVSNARPFVESVGLYQNGEPILQSTWEWDAANQLCYNREMPNPIDMSLDIHGVIIFSEPMQELGTQFSSSEPNAIKIGDNNYYSCTHTLNNPSPPQDPKVWTFDIPAADISNITETTPQGTTLLQLEISGQDFGGNELEELHNYPEIAGGATCITTGIPIRDSSQGCNTTNT